MGSPQQRLRSRAGDAIQNDESIKEPPRAHGDRKVAETVADDLLQKVKRRVRRLVQRDADVDDIAQEALVTIIAGLRGHRGDGSLSAWADRVAVRAAFAYLRRRRRAPVEVEADLSTVPAPDNAPDEYLDKRNVVRLLAEIPDIQRHALVLHHVVGMSVPEIAAAMAVPVETVRSRLRLGMGRLRGLHGREEDAVEGEEEASVATAANAVVMAP